MVRGSHALASLMDLAYFATRLVSAILMKCGWNPCVKEGLVSIHRAPRGGNDEDDQVRNDGDWNRCTATGLCSDTRRCGLRHPGGVCAVLKWSNGSGRRHQRRECRWRDHQPGPGMHVH